VNEGFRVTIRVTNGNTISDDLVCVEGIGREVIATGLLLLLFLGGNSGN